MPVSDILPVVVNREVEATSESQSVTGVYGTRRNPRLLRIVVVFRRFGQLVAKMGPLARFPQRLRCICES